VDIEIFQRDRVGALTEGDIRINTIAFVATNSVYRRPAVGGDFKISDRDKITILQVNTGQIAGGIDNRSCPGIVCSHNNRLT
jgi:hypothetical protein